MKLPSEKLKEMTMGKLIETHTHLICPIHSCLINTCESLSISWCPECVKACDEVERNYFRTIASGNPNPSLKTEAAIATRQYESEQGKHIDKIKMDKTLKYQAYDKDVKCTGYFTLTSDDAKAMRRAFDRFKARIEQIFRNCMKSESGTIGERIDDKDANTETTKT